MYECGARDRFNPSRFKANASRRLRRRVIICFIIYIFTGSLPSPTTETVYNNTILKWFVARRNIYIKFTYIITYSSLLCIFGLSRSVSRSPGRQPTKFIILMLCVVMTHRFEYTYRVWWERHKFTSCPPYHLPPLPPPPIAVVISTRIIRLPSCM